MNVMIILGIMSVTLFGGLSMGFAIGRSTADPKMSVEYKELYSNYLSAKTWADTYYQRYMSYLYKGFDKPTTKVIRECPAGTLEAVKLAMKVSHPDNGGKQEDFIKYRQIYLKLTGKEKW